MPAASLANECTLLLHWKTKLLLSYSGQIRGFLSSYNERFSSKKKLWKKEREVLRNIFTIFQLLKKEVRTDLVTCLKLLLPSPFQRSNSFSLSVSHCKYFVSIFAMLLSSILQERHPDRQFKVMQPHTHTLINTQPHKHTHTHQHIATQTHTHTHQHAATQTDSPSSISKLRADITKNNCRGCYWANFFD